MHNKSIDCSTLFTKSMAPGLSHAELEKEAIYAAKFSWISIFVPTVICRERDEGVKVGYPESDVGYAPDNPRQL